MISLILIESDLDYLLLLLPPVDLLLGFDEGELYDDLFLEGVLNEGVFLLDLDGELKLPFVLLFVVLDDFLELFLLCLL